MLNEVRKILGVKKERRLTEYLNIQGWLTINEAHGLFEIANLILSDSVVLEIGSWKGKSTCCIASGLKRGTINCIDPFNCAGEEGSKKIYEANKGDTCLLQQFKKNVANIPSSVNIKVFRGYSNEFIGAIKDIDFLFIDGDHSIEGCKFDFCNFEKYLKKGGYLAFHDYSPDRIDLGPTWVINNLVKNNRSYIFYKLFDTLCVFKKN